MATIKELEAKVKELQELNAQLAEKADKPDMTQIVQLLPDAKSTPTVPYVPTKKVTIELFKDDYRYKEPLFVGVNGRFLMIPRGKPVEVDDYIADFIEQQKAEEARIMRRVEAEEDEYKQKTAALNA